MRSKISLLLLSLFIILLLWSNPTFAVIGTPHIIYGKVFNSDGTPPENDQLEIYAYIPERPDEILDKFSVGCGYDLFGWLWFEPGNYPSPWSIDEDLRIIAIDNLLQETGVIDLVLDSSGNQLLSDLYLAYGDNVGPIASNTMVDLTEHCHCMHCMHNMDETGDNDVTDGTGPVSIPEGTDCIILTATLDDSISGNNDIQGAEYFVDTDPGPGLGTEMNQGDDLFDSPNEDVYAFVDTSSWTEGSTHTIYVRGQDSAGNWGTTHMIVIYITN